MEHLPDELLLRILCRLRTRDVQVARGVCRRWRAVVDDNAAALWQARCGVLGLLSEERSVLGACVEQLNTQRGELRRRMRHAEGKQRRALSNEIAALYRAHYRRWAAHVCRHCEPADLSDLCQLCTPPSTFRFIPYRTALNLLGTLRLKYYAPAVNALLAECRPPVQCPRPPHAPLDPTAFSVVFRWCDLLHLTAAFYGQRHADISRRATLSMGLVVL